jgi:hypothetical protein
MKKLAICLTCFLLFVILAPSLRALEPVPAAQADLAAQIFAPSDSAATASPADSVEAVSSSLFPASSGLRNCTYAQCLAQCSDCPWGHLNYCISTARCTCGCR